MQSSAQERSNYDGIVMSIIKIGLETRNQQMKDKRKVRRQMITKDNQDK